MATGDFPWRFASGFEKANKMNSFAFFFKVMDNPNTTPLSGIPTDKLALINQPGLEPMFPFLSQCFERVPENRPRAPTLLKLPWLNRQKQIEISALPRILFVLAILVCLEIVPYLVTQSVWCIMQRGPAPCGGACAYIGTYFSLSCIARGLDNALATNRIKTSSRASK